MLPHHRESRSSSFGDIWWIWNSSDIHYHRDLVRSVPKELGVTPERWLGLRSHGVPVHPRIWCLLFPAGMGSSIRGLLDCDSIKGCRALDLRDLALRLYCRHLRPQYDEQHHVWHIHILCCDVFPGRRLGVFPGS